jgi:hypothetical protein
MQVDDSSSITTTSSDSDDDLKSTGENLVNSSPYMRLMRQYRFLSNSKLKNDSCLEMKASPNSAKPDKAGTTASTSRATAVSSFLANINLMKNLVNRKLLSHTSFSSNAQPNKQAKHKARKLKKNPSGSSTRKMNVYSLMQSILNNKRNLSQKNLLKSTSSDDNNKAFMNEEEAANYFINNLNLIKTNIKYNKLFEFKNLQYLSLMNMRFSLKRQQLNEILLNLNEHLKYLNLTNACADPCLTDVQDRIKFKHSLNYLYFSNYDQNLNDFYANLNFLCGFKNLVLLDVSTYSNAHNVIIYKNASFILGKICFLLRNLSHLDVSGTNLGNRTSFLKYVFNFNCEK